MRRVYRIEHKDRGCGPYCSTRLGPEGFVVGGEERGNRPIPRTRGRWTLPDHRFAFPTKQAIKKWFDNSYEIKAMYAAGFRIRVYDVPPEGILIDEPEQVAFCPNVAKRIK